MPRDRSRSPRRKDRRRSRSRDRVERKPDEVEKRFDKFGRDVTSRPPERHGSRGFRDDVPLSSRRREEPRDRRDNKVDDRPPPPPPPQDGYGAPSYRGGNDYDNRPGGGEYNNTNTYNIEERQKVKEMFEAQEDDVDEETRKMQQLMGIGGFDTTKNKKVAGNVGGFSKINKTQRYRQYMNRRGGFNRPLDYVQ